MRAPPHTAPRSPYHSPHQAIDDRTIVVATRGECTYGAKARSAMLSGAAALVIVSEDDANDHLPAPDAAGLDFSVSTVHRVSVRFPP